MSKKYFFFDIDGTLTDIATGKIVPSAKEALDKLQENGHFVAIATGRAHYKAVHFTDAIGINDLVCSGGGGIVVDGKLIYNEPLNHKQITSILRHADEEGVGYLLMLDDSERVYMKDYRFLEQVGLRKELTTYIYEPTLDINQVDILKVYLAIPKGDDDKYPWMKEMPYLRFVGNYGM